MNQQEMPRLWALVAIIVACGLSGGCGGDAASENGTKPSENAQASATETNSNDQDAGANTAGNSSANPDADSTTAQVAETSPADAPPAENGTGAAAQGSESVTVEDRSDSPATVADAVKYLDLTTFPLMDGAVLSVPRRQIGEINYDVPASVVDAFKFQRQELEQRGWKMLPGARLDGENPMAQFTQQGFVVNVSTSPYSSRTGHATVWIRNHGNVLPEKLPVPEGAEPFYSTVTMASYVTAADTAQTAEAVFKSIEDLGWTLYGQALDSRDYKKNVVLLSVRVAAHPAQPGKTFINFSTALLSADLPVPASVVAKADYTDSMKSLHFDHDGDAVDQLAEFYATELGKLGWKATADPVGDETVQVVYRNDAQDMITLDMRKFIDITRVDVQHYTAAEVAEIERELAGATAQNDQPMPLPVEESDAAKLQMPIPGKAQGFDQEDDHNLIVFIATGSGKDLIQAYQKHFEGRDWKVEQTSIDKTHGMLVLRKGAAALTMDFMDNGFDEELEFVISCLSLPLAPQRGVESFASLGVVPAPTVAAAGAESNGLEQDGKLVAAQLPVPEGASDIERDPLSEMVIFRSKLTPTQVSEFYQKLVDKLGWKVFDDESFVDDDAGVVSFGKGDHGLRVIIQDGQPQSKTRVLVTGDGLLWTPADEEAALAGDPDLVTDPDSERGAEDAREGETAPQWIASGKCEGKAYLGDKQFEMKHALASQRTENDEPVLHVFLSEREFAQNALKLLSDDEVWIFDLVEGRVPSCMQIELQDDYASVSCFVDGKSINLGSGKIKNTIKKDGQKLTGRIYMVEPDDFFDEAFRFDVKVDVVVQEPVAQQPVAAGELAADLRYEVPVPKNTTEVMQSGTPYRQTIIASIDKDLAKVLGFYRTQLKATGWEEVADKTREDEESASLAFQGEQGAVTVKLEKRRGETRIELATVNLELAKEHGMVPSPGKAMIILANATDQAVTITLDGQAHQLAAGQGVRDPTEAVKLNDVTPGKHKVSAPGAGSEDVEVAADGTWGVIVLPTGGMITDRLF